MSGQMSPLDFVFPTEATLIAQDALGVTTDPQLARPITYRRYTGRTFTPSTGLWTPSYDLASLTAIRSILSAAEVAAAAGVYKTGDVRYLIAAATLAAAPDDDDQILTAEGDLFDLVRWDTDPVGAFYRLVMRQVKAA